MKKKNKSIFEQMYEAASFNGTKPALIILDRCQYFNVIWRFRSCFDIKHPAEICVENETEVELRNSLNRKEKGRITRMLKAGRLKITYEKVKGEK